ncbi:hypothetical protein ACHQM5_017687 [Ranunculus cassubicifolius]
MAQRASVSDESQSHIERAIELAKRISPVAASGSSLQVDIQQASASSNIAMATSSLANLTSYMALQSKLLAGEKVNPSSLSQVDRSTTNAERIECINLMQNIAQLIREAVLLFQRWIQRGKPIPPPLTGLETQSLSGSKKFPKTRSKRNVSTSVEAGNMQSTSSVPCQVDTSHSVSTSTPASTIHEHIAGSSDIAQRASDESQSYIESAIELAKGICPVAFSGSNLQVDIQQASVTSNLAIAISSLANLTSYMALQPKLLADDKVNLSNLSQVEQCAADAERNECINDIEKLAQLNKEGVLQLRRLFKRGKSIPPAPGELETQSLLGNKNFPKTRAKRKVSTSVEAGNMESASSKPRRSGRNGQPSRKYLEALETLPAVSPKISPQSK